MISQAVIRPVRPEEIPALLPLAREIWQEAYAGIITPAQMDYMLDMMYVPAVVERELAAGICWDVMETQGRLVGLLSYGVEDAEAVKLHKIYLLAETRGRGLAGKAIERVLDWARAQGRASMFLTVNRHNARAIRAYEKNGFEKAGTLVKDIGGGFIMDDYIMRRVL